MNLFSESECARLLRFADRLADEARQIAQRYFRQPLAIEDKQDSTPVTRADREIELRARELLETEFPDHGVVGEEYGESGAERSHVWVIDPIDGTQAFITGVPLFGTLIGLLVDGLPCIGVIEMPALGERWSGDTRSAHLNGSCVQVSGQQQLDDASLFATTPYMFQGADHKRFESVAQQAHRVRFGTDCYAYGLLASGFVDLVVEADVAPHDYLALVPVVTGAGGVMTDWQGQPLGLHSGGRVVAAASSALHAGVIETLRATA